MPSLGNPGQADTIGHYLAAVCQRGLKKMKQLREMPDAAARTGRVVIDDEIKAPADLIKEARIFVMFDNAIIRVIELLRQLELGFVQTGPDDLPDVIVEASRKPGIANSNLQDPFGAEVEPVDMTLGP